jgi:hypothetical protein
MSGPFIACHLSRIISINRGKIINQQNISQVFQ